MWSSDLRSLVTCFFFQAEDGIRDDLVTGVQTCALPISLLVLLCSQRSAMADSSQMFDYLSAAQPAVASLLKGKINTEQDEI